MMSCHAAVHGSLVSLVLSVYSSLEGRAAQTGPGSPEPRPLVHVAHRGIGKVSCYVPPPPVRTDVTIGEIETDPTPVPCGPGDVT